MNVPLHELLLRLDEVPAGRVWVHCATGYRAGVAASLLQRAGRDVVHVDARFAHAEAAGVPMDKAPELGRATLARRAAFSGRV